MQLSCAATVAIASLAAASAARAQPVADDDRAASASVQVYADDDHVTVWSPSASGHAHVSDAVAIDADTSVDAVTAASVDVTSQASARAFHETRVEGGLGARWTRDDLELRARAAGSTEHDYRALRVGLGARRALADRDTTLDLHYEGSFDRVGRVGDPDVWRARQVHDLELTVSQVIDPHTVAELVVGASSDGGYLASPYRFVPIVDAAGARRYSLPEAVPDRRLGVAALARVRRALGERWFVHASYRFTADTWDVRGHTVELRALRSFDDDRLAISADLRGYLQGAASFWRRTWIDDGSGAPAWRTLDRTLGGMWSASAAVTGDYAIGGAFAADGVHVFASVSLARFTWRDFPLQAQRSAVITAIGATAPF